MYATDENKKKMPKITQPTKMPPLPTEKIDALCDAVREGLGLPSACNFVELSLPQVEKWLRIYPALKSAIEKATADHEHRMIQLAARHAEKDGKLAIAILERRHSQWNKTERQEIRQETQGTVSPELLRALAGAPERVRPRGDTAPKASRSILST